MRVFITDEFLRDLYIFLQEAGNTIDSLFVYPTMRNSLPGLKNPVFEKYRKEKGMKKFNKLVYYLKRKGYIKSKNLQSKQGLIITKEGIDRAIKASFKLNRERRPDGKWVMVIFDIPDKSKNKRLILRSALLNLGFKVFQKSVWISPYNISEKIENFAQTNGLEDFLRIFLIEEIK